MSGASEQTGFTTRVAATSAASSFAWWIPIGVRLAWRNLAIDRTRLVTSVIGVSFSVFLTAVQLGLLIGFALTSSGLIDHSNADLWIVPHGTRDVDQVGDLPYRMRYEAEGVKGVASVAPLALGFAFWKTPTGATESVIVVGSDPEHPAIQPWDIVSGRAEDIRLPDGIIIDELYADKLGITRIGQTVEINGHRARVVAVTSGLRTFTQSPYVFASFNTAARLANIGTDRANYLPIRVAAGQDPAAVAAALQARFPYQDVWVKSDFSWQTRFYWLFTTGAGTALCVAALLGLIVGIVIVSQTLYAATTERISEYATLRALGATDGFIRSVILRQALAIAVLGYAAGIATAFIGVFAAANASPALMLPWWLAATLFVVTALMCAGASLLAVRKVLTLHPAAVFR
jgi:putative ABC transport system permease protein